MHTQHPVFLSNPEAGGSIFVQLLLWLCSPRVKASLGWQAPYTPFALLISTTIFACLETALSSNHYPTEAHNVIHSLASCFPTHKPNTKRESSNFSTNTSSS